MTEHSYRHLSDLSINAHQAKQNAVIFPRFFRFPEAVAYSGVSRTALYLLLGNGTIVARKSGRATLIDRESLDRYLDGLPTASIKAA